MVKEGEFSGEKKTNKIYEIDSGHLSIQNERPRTGDEQVGSIALQNSRPLRHRLHHVRFEPGCLDR